MAEEIYGPSVPHLQVKIVHHNIKNIEPTIITNTPKYILDKYNKFSLWCDLMHINGIGFLNTISKHVMFSTGSMIKYLKIKNTEDVIKQVHKLDIQRGFKTTRIHANSEFEHLWAEMDDIGISLDCASKK